MIELRCDSKMLHGTLDEGLVEVTCKSERCGKRKGVVVLHTFSTQTGELISTRLFQEPEKEVNPNGNGY